MPSLPSLSSFKPYRIDIQQGNFLSQEMVSQLKKGMTREQVRFVLGTPLVTDIFHANRWDYVFYREVPGGPPEHRQLSVFFENDRLERVAGDVKPADSAPAQGEGGKADAPKSGAAGDQQEVKPAATVDGKTDGKTDGKAEGKAEAKN